jgi:methylphosphotriester-DNA--protein-cysteine methyltransferase
MKHLLAVLIVSFVLMALPGCSSGQGEEVIAIEKTGMYHRPGCPLVSMAKTKTMSTSQAKTNRLKPCPRCKPDII